MYFLLHDNNLPVDRAQTRATRPMMTRTIANRQLSMVGDRRRQLLLLLLVIIKAQATVIRIITNWRIRSL